MLLLRPSLFSSGPVLGGAAAGGGGAPTEVTIYSDTPDLGTIYRADAVAADALAAAEAESVLDPGQNTIAWSLFSGNPDYRPMLSFVGFDTSSLPDAATITSATLSIYGYQSGDPINLQARIVSAPPASPPIVEDWLTPAAFAALSLAATTTASNAEESYIEFVSQAGMIPGINKTGTTWFAFQLDEWATAEDPPTTTDAYFSHTSGSPLYEPDIEYRPSLSITYTNGGGPVEAVVYSDGAADTFAESSDADSAVLRAKTVADSAGLNNGYLGYYDFGPGTFYCDQNYLAFDTSVIPDGATVTDVVLALRATTPATAWDDLEARLYSGWTTPADTAAWLTPAGFAALPLLATAPYDVGQQGGEPAVLTFTSEAGFPAAINKTGYTRIAVCSALWAANSATAPTDGFLETYSGATEPELGYDHRPKLVIEYTE